MPGKPRIIVDTILNTALLAVLVAVIALPGSPLRARYTMWQEGRRIAKATAEHWQALAQGASRLGDGAAPRIVEFGDYECPACRDNHPAIEEFLAQQPGRTLGYRHLPLTQIHPRAEAAARAAICAEVAGQFSSMHRLLLTTDEWLEQDVWGELAVAAGVSDPAEFLACLTSAKVDDRLASDRALADSLGITGTPAFVHRNGIHRGMASAADLSAIRGPR